jgi:hypothetical protein
MSGTISLYAYHAVQTRPRSWNEVAEALKTAGAAALAKHEGQLFGIFRNQIGRPREELSIITGWAGPYEETGQKTFLKAAGKNVLSVETRVMRPTLRPEAFQPPERQGNFAFRWFDTPKENYEEFLQLCAGAWPGFESAYDSQVLGLWRLEPRPAPKKRSAPVPGIETLLLTHRPNLAMWERSKIPKGAKESAVRRKLSRRYDLCDATFVFTTTLLTAQDNEDDVRWA